MPTGTQTRRIVISVDTKGNRDIKDLADKLGGVAKNTKSLAENMNILKNTFLGYISALGVREIARMSDEMQNLGNRLKLVQREGENSAKTMERILNLANATNQSVADVGTVYTRLASSLKSANASTGTLLEITEALINTFRVAGATGNETTATIIQLSQAFSSGQLRGQELRSVMEQNVELARLLRERFGKDIYKQAEKGLIGIVDVLKILRENQDRINAQAQLLAPTFEQTLTKAFNKARFAIFQLNEEFKLSAKFAAGMDAVIERLSLIAAVAGALALTQIPALIKALQALSLVMINLATKNPLLVAMLALSTVVIATSDNLTDFMDKIRNLGAWLVQLRVWILELRFAIDKAFAKGLIALGAGSRGIIESLARDLDEIKALKDYANELGTPKYRPSPLDPALDKKQSDQEFDSLLKKLEKMYGATEKAKKIKEILGEINQEFSTGTLSVQEYNKKLVDFELYKVNREFKEGKFDVFQYTERMNALKEQNFNRMFKEGVLTLEEFNRAIENMKLDQLREKFDAGKISAAEYNAELVKISRQFEPGGALMAGTQSYLDSIGTLSSNMADAIRETFTALEDSFLDFIKTGKFNFAQFTQAILDDLARIIVRASIVRPIADAILSAGFSGAASGAGSYGSAGGSYTNTGAIAAHGLAFDKGIRRFAKGGIVDSPTMFGYGKGSTGLMGEAGPEAILPLQRGKGGNLGVAATVTPVTVNVINQSGAEVDQTETTGPNGERTIEILIHNKVREGIVGGKFDKAMKSSFGLNRKGS